MNVLVIGFWGLRDPLTQASLMPTVRTLLDDQLASRVVLATVERDRSVIPTPLETGYDWIPLYASDLRPSVMARAFDLFQMRRKLVGVVRECSIQLIVARTSMAGNLALLASRTTGVPFIVESFEPHTAYMIECGEWAVHGIFAKFARSMERSQMRHALRLICVTQNYRRELIGQGLPPKRLAVVPSPVDHRMFKFNDGDRKEFRRQMGWTDNLVAIYVGKFGGIYHDVHAYRTFRRFHDRYGGRARSIILTPTPVAKVKQGLRKAGAPLEHMIIKKVDPVSIPRYLSGADLAFSLHRNTPSSRSLSPIKNGEYWANGLPIVQSRGVSDDSDLILQYPGLGALFDPAGDDLAHAFDRVEELLNRSGQRELTMKLAMTARPPDRLVAVYREIFDHLKHPSP